MNRRLRLDVMNDDAVFVFVFDFRGDFAIDDFLEEGFGHRKSFMGNSGSQETEWVVNWCLVDRSGSFPEVPIYILKKQ